MHPLNLRLSPEDAMTTNSSRIIAGILLWTLMALSSIAQAPSARFIDAEGKTLADVPTVLHDKRIYLPVDAVKTVFDERTTQQYNLPRKRLTLKTKGKTVRLEMGKTTVNIDAGRQTLELSVPPQVIEGTPMLPLAFFIEVLPVLDDIEVLYNPVCNASDSCPKPTGNPPREGASREWTVIIDPGHGGSDDRGCESNTGLLEKDVGLALAKQLQRISRQHGYQAHLTRETDVKKTQLERIQIANGNQGQLLLSYTATPRFHRRKRVFGFTLIIPRDTSDSPRRRLQP